MRAVLRQGDTFTFTDTLVVMECPVKGCGVTYGLSELFQQRRRHDGASWYCPNGHSLSYGNAIRNDEQRAKKAETKARALQDQLEAANREAEAVRAGVVRERHRIANGVCPCCNRSFDNVRRHMANQHPEYPSRKVTPLTFKCSCGHSFETYRGLRTHQGHQRGDDWAKPSTSKWWAHLTVTP